MLILKVLQDEHVHPDVCGPCGGECCKRFPGASFPHDWGKTPEKIQSSLLDALMTGQWCLDIWDGDPKSRWAKATDDHGPGDGRSRSYYVRPAVKGREGHVYDFHSFFEPCTFHTEKGCSIFEKRPTGCRAVIPDPTGKKNCGPVKSFGTKLDAVLAWYDYQELLEEVADLVDHDSEWMDECFQ